MRTKKSSFAVLALIASFVLAMSCLLFTACGGGAKVAIEWDIAENVTVAVEGKSENPVEWKKDSDLVFTVTVPDGYKATVKNGNTTVREQEGKYTIKPTKDITIKVTADKILNSITVTNNGTSIFFEGQTVSPAQLQVVANYATGNEVVTDFTISYQNGDAFQTGDTKFTVSFGGKTEEITVPAVRGAQDFSNARLAVEAEKVVLLVDGTYNIAGATPEAAKAAVESWFNDCTERNTWAHMTYTADATVEADMSFVLRLTIDGMTDGHQYYFHFGDGSDGKNFIATAQEGYVLVEGQKDHGARPLVPEGATFVEHDGAKYYLGMIPDWGDPVLIIYCENPNTPKFVNVSLEVKDEKPYAVINGTCAPDLEAEAAQELILGLVVHLDAEDIKNGNAKLADYVNGSKIVMHGEVVDETTGDVTTPGTPKASIEYNAADGTFKIYCLLEGDAVKDGSAFFMHMGTQGSDGYYPNVSLAGNAVDNTITCGDYTFTFATATDLELTESWQASLLYIKVTGPAEANPAE